MKKTYRNALFSIVVLLSNLCICAQADIVAYWPFGTNGLNDVSGNGNTLEKSAAGVILTNGVVRLDGSQTGFNSVNTLDLSSYTNLTVEFWMRTTNCSATAILVEQTVNYGENPGAFVAYTDGGANAGQVTAGIRASDGYNLDITPVGAADDGQWHHYAIVYDALQPGASRSRFYFDGLYQPTLDPHTADGAVSLLNAMLFIGSRANAEFKFIGEMDDIRISDAALPPSQFLQVSPGMDPRTIAYWPFTQGAEGVDVSDNGHTLWELSANDVGFRDGTAIFKGHSGLHTPAALDLSSYSAVTFECFVKTEVVNSDPLLAEISGNMNSHPGTFAVSAGMLTPGTMGAGYKTDSGYNIEVATAGAIEDGQWHHIAYVMDLNAPDATDRTQLYLDGSRQTKTNFSAETTPFAATSRFSLAVGRHHLTSTSSAKWTMSALPGRHWRQMSS